MPQRRAIFVTTEDRFFLSHRLPIARALQRAGYAVTVAARDTGEAAAVRAHDMAFCALPIVRGSVSPPAELRVVAALTRLYRRTRPALVHHSTIKANVYGTIAARLTRVPAVVNTVTGLGFALTERPSDDLPQRLLRRVASACYGFALNSPGAATIFQNADQRAAFVRAGLVDAAHSTLVRGAGVDSARFTPSPLPSGTPLVVLPARMLWDKGVGELVLAARLLRTRGVAVRIALVGGEDPENGAAISRAQLDAWAQEGIVEWWGFRQDMPEVLRQASLVVLPSYAEGLPLAVAEAQAAGRACITSDAPGCREAIVPGESGLLVPVRDAEALATAIAALLADRGRLAKMGARARRYAVETLSVERVVQETLAVFARLGVPL